MTGKLWCLNPTVPSLPNAPVCIIGLKGDNEMMRNRESDN
jgi:hypothetical protein